MTGNFKLRTVENYIDTSGKWIIHADNINLQENKFYNMENYNLLVKSERRLNLFEVVNRDDYQQYCLILSHDKIRPLSIEEYFILERFLRSLNRRYNKKQDKLIKVL